MIELARHIEILLLENDCVIVPELGGFIAHHQPSHYEENEGIFLPPTRTVGFNPQLTMNDGLLVQAYMQTHHTDFPDASRMLSKIVGNLKETLYNEGIAEMPGIGTLHYTMYGNYEFHPLENGVLSPDYYGLDAFSMTPLSAEIFEEPVHEEERPIVEFPEKKRELTLNTSWLRHAVAVAIAIILFFTLSVPVENTYIDKGNYASLGTDGLFNAIRSQSVATSLNTKTIDGKQKSKSSHVVPVVVKVEKVAQTAKVEEAPKTKEISKNVETPKVVEASKPKTTPKTAPKVNEAPKTKAVSKVEVKKKYHVIVASLATSSDAKRMLQEYKQQGYTGASILESKGRFRIAIDSYEDKSVAYGKLNELKKADAFKNAWMLTSK
ncbi:MAG: SPOR domain-containing protein [Bacteroidaceae bacterium]|nr:SPOR domain-containing protein [Bacteroidaceae bacterium]